MFSRATDIPFAPRRFPIFYGWVVLLVGAIGVVMSAPGQTLGVSPFTEPLLEVLGLSRVELSTAYMFGTIASALFLTYGGLLYDRHGARVMGPASCLLLGVSLVYLSQCDRLAAALSARVPLVSPTVSAYGVVTFGFFLLRFSGQGLLTMVSRNMVMQWFDRHRGLVTGIMAMAMAPCFTAAPILLNTVVYATGWRGAWLWMALIVGVAYSVVAAIFYRDNPEDCGLQPDGPLAHRALGSRRPADTPRVQFTLAEARRRYVFWVFAVGLSVFSFYFTGLSFHIASIFESAGLPADDGFAVFLPGAVAATVLRLPVGWLCDRIPLKLLLIAMLAGVGVSALGLALLGPAWSVWLVIAGNAIAGAVFGTLSAVCWPDFFGRKHLGAISGLNLSVLVFASAIGPWLFGESLVRTASYATAGTGTIVAAFVLIAASIRADSPQPG